MDLVLRAIWDKGSYHIVVEFSNVVDQLIWMKEYDYLEYDFFAIPKFGFSYDVNARFFKDCLRSRLQVFLN